MKDPLLELHDVGHSYGSRVALHDVAFSLHPGEVVALVGRNGAGKTTLLRLITELLPLSQGVIRRHKRSVGYVPQRVVIWPDLTVTEQLEFMCDMQEVPASRAQQAAEQVGLGDRMGTLGSALSGGMQRRLSIALALLHQPGVLVLDEPNAGLDPNHRVSLRELLRSFAAAGTGILLASHDLAEVERVADRVALLEDGHLTAIAPVAEFLEDGSLEGRFA